MMEKSPEKREFFFDEGLEKAVERIKELLEAQDGVVITITGSGSDVGKTFLGDAIRSKLSEQGIPSSLQTDLSLLTYKPSFFGTDGVGRVLIFGAEGIVFNEDAKVQDEKMRAKSVEFGLPFQKIDLRIFICKPDLPFEDFELECADIVIVNEKAVAK